MKTKFNSEAHEKVVNCLFLNIPKFLDFQKIASDRFLHYFSLAVNYRTLIEKTHPLCVATIKVVCKTEIVSKP